MKIKWMFLAVAAAMVAGATMGAGGASAQGPAGAGAGGAAGGSSTSSSSPRSYNPIKWVKKNPKSADDQLDANSARDKKLAANLQAAGVLPADKDLKAACSSFKDLSDCVAALRVSHNLGLDFNCVQADVTGVYTGADVSSCKGAVGEKAGSLSKAIHTLKPEADAKAEAKSAEKQAKDDLKEAGA
jgi:hypothetical protein